MPLNRPISPRIPGHAALAQVRARLAANPGPLEQGLLSERLDVLARTGTPDVQRAARNMLAQLRGAGPLQQGLRLPRVSRSVTPETSGHFGSFATAETQETAETTAAGGEDALPYPPQLADRVAEHPLLQGLDPSMRQALQAVSDQITGDATTNPAEEDLRLVAFFANVSTERDLGGMYSARAVWRVWNALHRVALTLPCTPPERAVLARLLRMYQGYYATALLSAYFRALPAQTDAYAALLERTLLRAMAAPHAPQAMHTGFPGHAVVMRLAVVHNATNDGEAGDAYLQAQAAIRRALGSAASARVLGEAHGRPLLLRCVYHDVKSPQALAHLLTPSTCLVHRGPRRSVVAVSTCDSPTRFVPIDELAAHLEALGRVPVPNALKVTLHNGGAGAELLPDGRTKTFDRRILLPLDTAAKELATLQQAAAQDMVRALAALHDLLGYRVEDGASLALSPSLSAQNLGNCTVHSQKLFLHYELQHLEESDTPLPPEEGERLFARLWPALLQDALDRAAHTIDVHDSFTRSVLSRAAAVLRRG